MIIKNAYVIDPKNGIEGMKNIWISDGKIAEIKEINKNGEREAEGDETREEIIDAKGMWVIPGAIDLHVHLREPGFEYKEDIETGAKSAAKGGVTTIVAMPNTKPVVDHPEVVDYIYKKAREKACVNVLQVGAITKGQAGTELAAIEEMSKAGICAISEDGRTVMDSKLLKEAMVIAKDLNLPILSHCEDEALAGGAMNEGEISRKLGLAGIPKEAEDIITARDIQLAAAVGAKLHLCHVSTASSTKIIHFAKEQGVQVTAEVCPHHFSLTQDAVDGKDANTKMNPPLREKEDVEALKKGLQSGIIDCIATDHAPHHIDEKKKSYQEAPNGIIGLETMIPLTITELVEQGYLSPSQMVEKISVNPAKVLGIDKGHLGVGAVADLVLIDPKAQYILSVKDFASKSTNTPFLGKAVQGRVMRTLVAGKTVYQYE
ncbi:MAG: dihydroorotase [Vallitaleaceae bacterium]|nr:dihydroorotase [Vallitaleaceae bacterium]